MCTAESKSEMLSAEEADFIALLRQHPELRPQVLEVLRNAVKRTNLTKT